MKSKKSKIPKIKLDKCIKRFGGIPALADFLGISCEAIYNRQREGRKYLPSTRAFQVAAEHPDLVEKR